MHRPNRQNNYSWISELAPCYTCLVECPWYKIKDTSRCTRHTEAFRCLHIKEAMTAMIRLVFGRGRLVFMARLNSRRRVGALACISLTTLSTMPLKSLLGTSASTLFVAVEHRDDTSFCIVRPRASNSAFLAEAFFSTFVANDWKLLLISGRQILLRSGVKAYDRFPDLYSTRAYTVYSVYVIL